METIKVAEMRFTNDSERIMFLVEKVFGAKNLETAVSMEQIIEKGIEMKMCEDYPRGKEDGHPWYPHTSTMCGISEMGRDHSNYEPHLHRAFVKLAGHKTKSFVYWVDRSKVAEVIGRNGKTIERQAKQVETTPIVFMGEKRRFTDEQMEQKVKDNPDKYVILNGKLYLREFILTHPEKFDAVAVAMAK